MSSPTERLVDDVASVHFGATGVAIKQHGVEIDGAGKRSDTSQSVLRGRLGASLQRLNPGLPHDTLEGVVRTVSRQLQAALVQNSRWFHGRLTGIV